MAKTQQHSRMEPRDDLVREVLQSEFYDWMRSEPVQLPFGQMTIAELLMYVADPLNLHQQLSPDEYKDLSVELDQKVLQGRRALEKVRKVLEHADRYTPRLTAVSERAKLRMQSQEPPEITDLSDIVVMRDCYDWFDHFMRQLIHVGSFNKDIPLFQRRVQGDHTPEDAAEAMAMKVAVRLTDWRNHCKKRGSDARRLYPTLSGMQLSDIEMYTHQDKHHAVGFETVRIKRMNQIFDKLAFRAASALDAHRACPLTMFHEDYRYMVLPDDFFGLRIIARSNGLRSRLDEHLPDRVFRYLQPYLSKKNGNAYRNPAFITPPGLHHKKFDLDVPDLRGTISPVEVQVYVHVTDFLWDEFFGPQSRVHYERRSQADKLLSKVHLEAIKPHRRRALEKLTEDEAHTTMLYRLAQLLHA